MRNDVEYPMFSNFEIGGVLAEQCANLYCRIWKEPPWCEDFWIPDQVEKTLRQELLRPDAGCVLALIEYITGCRAEPPDPICTIGFTWGYSVDRQELAEIAGGNQLDFITESTPRVFYIDELGVDPDNRLKGVGRKLTTKLIIHAQKCGHRRIALRTDLRAIPARVLYRHLGFTELDVKDSRHENRTYWLLDL